MHVVVVGCGRVGSALARHLVASGHEVTVVDRRPDAFLRLGADFGGGTLTGVGFDREVLQAAGIERAGALAAVTSGDNSNILAARVARERFGLERVVARIADPRRAAVYQRLGITTVATVAWTTDQVLRRILPENAAVEWADASASVSMVERTLPARWVGQRVLEVEAAAPVRVVAVSRLGVGRLPGPDLVVQDGDIVHLAVASADLGRLDAALDPSQGGHS